MTPLSVIAFLDRRPGHDKQTRGVVQALASLTAVDATYRDIPAPGILRDISDWSRYFLSFIFPRLIKKETLPTDIIIGTGIHTHIPMLRQWRASAADGSRSVRVIACMSPSQLIINKFDLCFVPQHERIRDQANVFRTCGPPNTLVPVKHDGLKGLILVGGLDKKSHFWNTEEVIDNIKIIIERENSRHWTISSSPRTPADTVHKARLLADQERNVSFFSSDETPPGWIEEQYTQSACVWVTADSISMIYEALSAGCSVGILPVKWVKTDNKFQRSINSLQLNKQVISFADWLAGQECIAPQTALNEASRCAREILQRWWPERLP